MTNLKQLMVTICLACVPGLVASVEPGEQIQIHADYMQFDINTGDSVYRGNVHFVRGKVELSGDRVNVSSKDGEVIRVKVEGTPARYHDSNETGRVLAESERMDYAVTQGKLTLLGTARLEQDDRVVQSQQIIYDTEKKLILAGKSSSQNAGQVDRVNITLTPKKDRTP
jgi:lipopolysaccharide export system protein LptA